MGITTTTVHRYVCDRCDEYWEIDDETFFSNPPKWGKLAFNLPKSAVQLLLCMNCSQSLVMWCEKRTPAEVEAELRG